MWVGRSRVDLARDDKALELLTFSSLVTQPAPCSTADCNQLEYYIYAACPTAVAAWHCSEYIIIYDLQGSQAGRRQASAHACILFSIMRLMAFGSHKFAIGSPALMAAAFGVCILCLHLVSCISLAAVC